MQHYKKKYIKYKKKYLELSKLLNYNLIGGSDKIIKPILDRSLITTENYNNKQIIKNTVDYINEIKINIQPYIFNLILQYLKFIYIHSHEINNSRLPTYPNIKTNIERILVDIKVNMKTIYSKYTDIIKEEMIKEKINITTIKDINSLIKSLLDSLDPKINIYNKGIEEIDEKIKKIDEEIKKNDKEIKKIDKEIEKKYGWWCEELKNHKFKLNQNIHQLNQNIHQLNDQKKLLFSKNEEYINMFNNIILHGGKIIHITHVTRCIFEFINEMILIYFDFFKQFREKINKPNPDISNNVYLFMIDYKKFPIKSKAFMYDPIIDIFNLEKINVYIAADISPTIPIPVQAHDDISAQVHDDIPPEILVRLPTYNNIVSISVPNIRYAYKKRIKQELNEFIKLFRVSLEYYSQPSIDNSSWLNEFNQRLDKYESETAFSISDFTKEQEES